jgi:phage baseplate assembly protein W
MAAILGAKAFQGIGWAFPLCVAFDGSTSVALYEEDIRQAILIILGTNHGERVMRADFGAGLRDFVFEPLNLTTSQKVRTRVNDSLVQWEPRIDVIDVTVQIGGDTRNVLNIAMTYRTRTTNTLHNLVYPFYLEEGSAE